MATIQDTPLHDFPIAAGIGALTLSGFTSGGGVLSATGASSLSVLAEYNVDTCVRHFFMKVSFTLPIAGEVFLGKNSAGNPTGTLISISSDNNLRIYSWQTTRTLVATIAITGITISNGGEYNVTWRKTGYAHSFSIERIGAGTFTAAYEWPTQATLPGNAYGKPCVGIYSGTIEVSAFEFCNNNLSAEFAIFGDSFCDATAYAAYYNANWPKQFKNRIGDGAVFVAARGGENINTIETRFNSEFSWLLNAKYVIIAIGTNTSSISSFTTRLNAMIAVIESRKAIPILTTVVRTSQQADVNNINALVRSSGRPYIEFANALTTDSNNNVWKDGFVGADNIHPTTLGYNAMYDQLIYDLERLNIL